MSEVFSIRLDEKVYLGLKDIQYANDRVEEYINFLVETEGTGPTTVKDFLDSVLSSNDIDSIEYLFVNMLANGKCFNSNFEYDTNIGLLTKGKGIEKERIIQIHNKWLSFMDDYSTPQSVLAEVLHMELRKRDDYQSFLDIMKERMGELFGKFPKLSFILSEYVYSNKYFDYREEFHLKDFESGNVEEYLKKYFPEEYEALIIGLLESGAAFFLTTGPRKNREQQLRFCKLAYELLSNHRLEKFVKMTEHLSEEIDDDLFKDLKFFVDLKQDRPHAKEFSVNDRKVLFDEHLEDLVTNHWVLVRSKFLYRTSGQGEGKEVWLTPAALEVIKNFALKRI